jgi:hypothetical protein
MEEQMSLFDMGGLTDDGAMRDPVSGNDVPPGSMATEVQRFVMMYLPCCLRVSILSPQMWYATMV